MTTRHAIMLLLSGLLPACASLKPPPAAPTLPASLRQPCPPLPLPADGSGAAVLRTMVEWGAMYRECADRHAAVVRAAQPTHPE